MTIPSQASLRFLIAGGKTGGHLFPGIAIALALIRLAPKSQILFVGTGEPFETDTVTRYGFTHRRIDSSGIKGKGIWQKIKAMGQIPLSILQAIGILWQFKPDMVVGVGGYASGPVLLAARLFGTKTAIHEQNSMAGITNRILSRLVHTVFTSYPKTKGLEQAKEVILTGNPIRKEDINRKNKGTSENGTSLQEDSTPFQKKNEFNIRKALHILVTGGSQGAKSINSAVMAAVDQLSSNRPKKSHKAISVEDGPGSCNKNSGNGDKHRNENKNGDKSNEMEIHLIHQTGTLDEERILDHYDKLRREGKMPSNLHLTAQAFFNTLPDLMERADLIICRAGAGTLSELTAIGRPALLVPYPFAADDHQSFNGKTLEDQGAAWMIADHDLTGEAIMEKIEYAAAHPEAMKKMAAASKAMGMPHADESIAKICIRMTG